MTRRLHRKGLGKWKNLWDVRRADWKTWPNLQQEYSLSPMELNPRQMLTGRTDKESHYSNGRPRTPWRKQQDVGYLAWLPSGTLETQNTPGTRELKKSGRPLLSLGTICSFGGFLAKNSGLVTG